MKKLILSATLLFAGAFGVLAQGVVTFDNASWIFTDGIDRNVYASTVGGELLDNPTYSAGLFENRGGVWTQLGALCSFDWGGATIPGVWQGDGVDRAISVGRGTATQLEVKIFDAQGGVLATSDPFTYTHNATDPLPTDGTLMLGFRAFAVPEPSTVALGVLGLGALILFRRRK